MNRIDRLTAILIQLQSKRWVTSIELADRFSICQRTVYRDLKALGEAGVPIGAEAGKGYFLVDGYNLPPVMFSKAEAGALMLGEKLIEKMTDQSVVNQFKTALLKIKAVLPDSEKDFIESLNSKVEVLFTQAPYTADFSNDYITRIQKSLANRKCLKIDYFAQYSSETSMGRIIDPIGLVFYGNQWHLIAFCRLRNELRDFRLDRIKQLEISETNIERNTDGMLKLYFENLKNTSDLHEVSVWFDSRIAGTLNEVKYFFGYIDETLSEGGVVVKFAVSGFDYISRWLISYGNMIKVIEPVDLQQVLIERVKELSKIYLSK